MGSSTRIEYLDSSLNVYVGCRGEGCAVSDACWAKGQAKRQKPLLDRNGHQRGCQQCYNFTPHMHPERLNQALQRKQPSVIGLNFMADTFQPEFKDTNQLLLEMCNKAPQHWFIVLTKLPQNIPKCTSFPANVILGVSVNCKADVWRIEELKKAQCALKMVSFEPLFENLALEVNLDGVDWIVIGARKRPTLQPQKQWVTDLTHVAGYLNIPVFWKNNLKVFSGFEGKMQNYPAEIYETKFFGAPAIQTEKTSL
jgi:protein gp37